MRADVVQNERGGWGGTTGIQYLNQDARIRGDEKYLPDSTNRGLGLFTLQSLVKGPIRFEGGSRVEFTRLHADEDEHIAEIGEESATIGEGRIGQIRSPQLHPGLRLARRQLRIRRPAGAPGLSLSHSERAPSIDELFSLGPHGGSQQFLIGNPDLTKEAAIRPNSASIARPARCTSRAASITAASGTSFTRRRPTRSKMDCRSIEYGQGKATYYGFELESDAKFGHAFGVDWGGEVVADAVRATIKGFGPAPQIPPFRVLGALTGSHGQVDGRLEVERTSAQQRTAPNETPTPGFTMVNASFDWHPFAANPELTLSLQGNNLFDVDARRSDQRAQGFRAARRPRHPPVRAHDLLAAPGPLLPRAGAAPKRRSPAQGIVMFNWFQRLLPRTGDFFGMFEAHAATLVGGGRGAAAAGRRRHRDERHIAEIQRPRARGRRHHPRGADGRSAGPS